MIKIDEVVENRTISNIFGVAIMGGMRYSESRNLMVLISNNRNEWHGRRFAICRHGCHRAAEARSTE
jgi:hypothetical protein